MIGALVGFPLMRLSGISASIATFSILVVVYVGLGNWTSITGGQNSLMGLPNYVGLWTAAIWAVAAIAIAFAYQESRGGLLLRASREDEVAARAAGVDIVRHRWIAFTLSAFLSGVSGVLLAHFLGTVRVETYYLDLTFLIIAMLVIGGAGSLTGAVFGALAISALTEALREAEVGFSIGGTAPRRAGRTGRQRSRASHARHHSLSAQGHCGGPRNRLSFAKRVPWPDAMTPRRATPPRTTNSNRPMDDTPPPPNVDPSALSEIANGVFVIGDKRVPLVPNIGIVLGDDAALVIDTGMGPANGAKVLEVAKDLAGSRPLDSDPYPLSSGAWLRRAGLQGRREDHLQ